MNRIGLRTANIFDFNNKTTPKSQAQALFVTTVAGRLAYSRGKEEFRETMTRDIPGFFTFYYLSGIIENLLGYQLDKNSKYPFKLIKGPKKRSFAEMLNPFQSKFKVKSFDDLNGLKNPEIKGISTENLNELMKNKSIVYAVGLIIPILTLGILIPKLNVLITREQNLKQDEPKSDTFGINTKLNKTDQFFSNLMQINPTFRHMP